jgi:hypothetical protein
MPYLPDTAGGLLRLVITALAEPSVRAAHGSCSQPLYSVRDILVLKVMKRLLATGISLPQIRAALSEIMRGSQVPPRDAVPAGGPGHGRARGTAGGLSGVMGGYP